MTEHRKPVRLAAVAYHAALAGKWDAATRWAGQLVAARAAMDEPKFMGLIDELPEDGFEIGAYVGAVLSSVAMTINGLPRGFARMGQAQGGGVS